MFFPVKRHNEQRIHDTRNVTKFAWWPVRIEAYGRYRGMVWLEHYTVMEDCVATVPREVWSKVATFYPAVD